MQELVSSIPTRTYGKPKNRLPHWQQQGAVYFVTFRLADAVPLRLLNQWEIERENWYWVHPEPWSPELEQEYHQRFSGAIERWLERDMAHVCCGVVNVHRSSWRR